MKPSIYKKRLQTARRRRYKRQGYSGRNYLETFITQCIVSGIILSAVLVIRIIDVPVTAAIREQFYQSITSNVDVPTEARNLGAMLRGALGDTDDSGAAYESIAPVNTNVTGDDFRIDEDILESMRERDAGTP